MNLMGMVIFLHFIFTVKNIKNDDDAWVSTKKWCSLTCGECDL